MSAYWPLIFVLLAIAMAVGPIMLMRPSTRDKRLAHLRQQAALQGLHVRLVDYENKKVAVYSSATELPKTTPSWQLVRRAYAHGIHFHDQWQLSNKEDVIPATRKQTLSTFLDDLPDDIVGVEVKPKMLGVWWRETADGSSLEDITALLKRLESILS